MGQSLTVVMSPVCLEGRGGTESNCRDVSCLVWRAVVGQSLTAVMSPVLSRGPWWDRV